ncbi:MAG: AraC family transcriptional regulator [Chitinophagales bacterium]|nr:AraC family transcriptional regulator [Chitinophagales bacterium]
MDFLIIINLCICIVYIIKGFRVKDKTVSFKLFLFYDFLLATILLAFLLNSLKLSSSNLLLNFSSLFYFVACIAMPPTVYVYVKNLNFGFTNHSTPVLSLQHFIPAFVLLIINLFSFAYFNIARETHIAYHYIEEIMNYSNIFALFFVFLIQVIFYTFLSINEYQSYRKKINDLYSFEEGVDLKWVKIFLGGFVIFVVSIYVIQAILDNKLFIFGIIIALYLLSINYSAFKQEIIYKKTIAYQKVKNAATSTTTIDVSLPTNDTTTTNKTIISTQQQIISDEPDTTTIADEKNITIDTAIIVELYQKIRDCMEDDKLYIDPELSLGNLADILNTNTKYLSFCINSYFGKNFSNFINEYRVQEAMRLINSDHINQYTLEAIAELSGFKSRSAFIAAFKKVTGQTPSHFKKNT